MNKTRIFSVLALAALSLSFVGCGDKKSSSDSESTPSEGTAATLNLAADPDGGLSYDKSTLSSDAGKVTIALTNDAAIEHDVAIEGNGVDAKSELVSNGGTTEVSSTLKAGTYTFFCTVPGHRQGGMEGTLTVK